MRYVTIYIRKIVYPRPDTDQEESIYTLKAVYMASFIVITVRPIPHTRAHIATLLGTTHAHSRSRVRGG